jgi:LysR family glycine cleavage system transcriptional activator
MTRRLPPLTSLKAFEAASRLSSFQAAARELNVSPSALSYQIRVLEEDVGTPLFERGNRTVSLTDAGRRFAPGVQAAFEQFAQAMAALARVPDSRVLTVSSGPSFAAKWLSPRLHRFIEMHPGIDIRISASLKLADLRNDGVDVAIRFGGGAYPGLAVEPMFDDGVLPLMSPALAETLGPAPQPQALVPMTLIHDDSSAFMPGAPDWAAWLRRVGVQHPDPARGPRFNHADHAIEAAVEGAGVALGRLAMAARDLAAGRLVAPFRPLLPSPARFYFCTLPENADAPKVAAFRAFIFAEAAIERPVLAFYGSGG